MALSHGVRIGPRSVKSLRYFGNKAVLNPFKDPSDTGKLHHDMTQGVGFLQGSLGISGGSCRFGSIGGPPHKTVKDSKLLRERLPDAYTKRSTDVAEKRAAGGRNAPYWKEALKKSRLLARLGWSGGMLIATYEAHLCRLVISFSPDRRTPRGASDETAAASATAGCLLRASSVCEGAGSGGSLQGHSEVPEVSALVDYAFWGRFARASTQMAGYPTERLVMSFHLPTLSPAALSEVVYLCGVRMGIKDREFFEEASRVALRQLESLKRPNQPKLSQVSDRQGPNARWLTEPRQPMSSSEISVAFASQIKEVAVKSCSPPTVSRIARLLRGLAQAGHESPELFDAGVEYLASECTYSHSDLLHALALLKRLSPGAIRDKLAQPLASRILVRERRLPLVVVAAASNVFSFFPQSPPSCNSSECMSSFPALEDLYASLARSAKRALELHALGLGDHLRGRDLALLARGFVRSRQHTASTPWLLEMELQWKTLRLSVDPQSLSLLLVSLSKLQHGLP